MVNKIEKDHARFQSIVRGKIRENLRKYITHSELIGRKGKNIVSIPLPQIEPPAFRFDPREGGGVGQGEGDSGEPIGQENADGGSQAGDQPGEHVLEVDLTLEELAAILGEGLELPRIEPRGNRTISTGRDKYTSIHRSGPEALRHFRRTYRQALKRQIASGQYNFKNPMVFPIRDDRRYRSRKVQPQPESAAVIIYMMDVSGSMGFEQKEIVRIESFWLDTWLRSQYRSLETKYIVHDVAAKQVDQHTFFHIRESGGTKISSAYVVANKLIDQSYPPDQWNIYLFHFSDGDNWGGDDTKRCVEILKESLIPKSNLFCYGQVKSAYGSGQFVKDLRESFPEEEKVVLSEITSKDAIYDSIRDFLGKGK
ncbi:MAG: DUF444 family protein [Planctomycetota bacterium]|nr:DUF444 family protein [Planctomycetota bacterium]